MMSASLLLLLLCRLLLNEAPESAPNGLRIVLTDLSRVLKLRFDLLSGCLLLQLIRTVNLFHMHFSSHSSVEFSGVFELRRTIGGAVIFVVVVRANLSLPRQLHDQTSGLLSRDGA